MSRIKDTSKPKKNQRFQFGCKFGIKQSNRNTAHAVKCFFVILESFELRIAQHKSVTTTASNIPWNRWYEEMYHYFFGVKKILKFFLRIVFQFMVPNNPKSISKRSLSSFFWERKEWRFCLMQSWCRTGSKEFSVEFIQSKNEKFEMAETCTNRSLDLDSSQKNTKRSEIFVRTN